MLTKKQLAKIKHKLPKRTYTSLERVITRYNELDEQERKYWNQIWNELLSDGKSKTHESIMKEDFIREPVSPREFFTNPYYIGPTGKDIFPKWIDELCYVCDPNNGITEWVITGPLGGGKTTTAVNAIAYKKYYLSCLKNPQQYYGLMEGHTIMVGLFNILKYKVKTTSFNKLEAIINYSPYFKNKFARDPRNKNTLKFPHNLEVLSGSDEEQFRGDNLFIFLLDEANFFKTGKDDDVPKAYRIYNEALNRMQSRFTGKRGIRPWLLIIVSSKSQQTDFTNKRIEASVGKSHIHVSDFPIWEIKGRENFSKEVFYVQIGDSLRASKVLDPGQEPETGLEKVAVPVDFRDSFDMDVDLALANVVGVATTSTKPLIRRKESIMECIDYTRQHPFWQPTIPSNFLEPDPIEGYLDFAQLTRISSSQRIPIINPHVPRQIHVDVALTNDSLGICMGHPAGEKIVKRIGPDGLLYTIQQTIIYIDFMIALVPEGEIDLESVRLFIMCLRDSLGFIIGNVSYDGFQSRESIQLLIKNGFDCSLLSVDRNIEPYSILRSSVLEARVDFYQYEPFLKELVNLELDNKKGKVDHPEVFPDGTKGSKDVADAVAAVVFKCSKADTSDSTNHPPTMEMIKNSRKGETQKNQLPSLHKMLQSRAGGYVPDDEFGDLSWVVGKVDKKTKKALQDMF